MAKENVKEQLIRATMKLLTESKSPGKITARQIASGAGANLAMINYYFSSKDALINTAVGRIIEDKAVALKDIRDRDIPARQKLVGFLTAMSDITVAHSELTRHAVPYALLEGEIEQLHDILPIIRECWGDKKTETECRIIAYQLTAFLQLIFYRSADFLKYTGIDITHRAQRNNLLQTLLDLFI